ncbi:hypothetical protein [Geopseudomonas aromaticivorans]
MTVGEAPAIDLTPGEARHLVRLVTDRCDRTLRKGDAGVSARLMNNLTAKGLAEIIDGGWRLTEAGRARSTAIY